MSNYKISRDYFDIKVNENTKVAFVVWEFNRDYTKQLEELNKETLKNHWITKIDSFLVPGSFEIPWFARKLLDKKNYDIIICIWVVVRWETPHFDYVCNEVSRWIMDLTLKYETPIIFWILTCNDFEQVKERINDNFAITAIKLLNELKKLW